MFIVHTNGHPIAIKTNRGDRFVAFETFDDGQAFLRWKQAPCTLSTLEEILALNPMAFPREFSVLHLPNRQTIEMFANNPTGFPTDEFLVTLKHDVLPGGPETPATPGKDNRQDELGI